MNGSYLFDISSFQSAAMNNIMEAVVGISLISEYAVLIVAHQILNCSGQLKLLFTKQTYRNFTESKNMRGVSE